MKFGRVLTIGKFTCTITFDTDSKAFDVAWLPDVPTRDTFTVENLKEYQQARNALLTEAAEHLGQELVVIE